MARQWTGDSGPFPFAAWRQKSRWKWRFKPELSPAEMLHMGVFGGKYLTDGSDEFPDEWFEEAKLSPERRIPRLNFFSVDASRPLSRWEDKSWIWPDDSRNF